MLCTRGGTVSLSLSHARCPFMRFHPLCAGLYCLPWTFSLCDCVCVCQSPFFNRMQLWRAARLREFEARQGVDEPSVVARTVAALADQPVLAYCVNRVAEFDQGPSRQRIEKEARWVWA